MCNLTDLACACCLLLCFYSLKNFMQYNNVYSRQHLGEMMQQALGSMPVVPFHLDALADVASRLEPLKQQFDNFTYPQVRILRTGCEVSKVQGGNKLKGACIASTTTCVCNIVGYHMLILALCPTCICSCARTTGPA